MIHSMYIRGKEGPPSVTNLHLKTTSLGSLVIFFEMVGIPRVSEGNSFFCLELVCPIHGCRIYNVGSFPTVTEAIGRRLSCAWDDLL